MTIEIEDLKFKCIIGILDFERKDPQDIIINLQIIYNYEQKFINYADISEYLKSVMIEKKFLLIEEALEYLVENLKKKFTRIQKLHLKITKPSIMPDCRVSVSIARSFNS